MGRALKQVETLPEGQVAGLLPGLGDAPGDAAEPSEDY
jgi:hypothetical protein